MMEKINGRANRPGRLPSMHFLEEEAIHRTIE